MSREVDDRVVSMSFDNKKFEANVKESMSTIDKLKEKLNFDNVKDSFSHVERGFQKFDVSPVTKGIDKVKVSFSSLQVVGATVISELTKKIMGIGTTFTDTFKSVIGQIKSGGMSRALNYEAGKFQMESLGVKWDKIKDDIQYAVLGTPFGGDEATRVAAQLATTGIKVGDEMKAALRGISGAAAMTNSSFSEMGDVFADVAGQGKVTGDTLMRMATRGMNAAAVLGKAMGKSETEIREMTRKGEIDFKTFAKVMDDNFGKHATEANKTYSGALANMKSALSRLGQNIAEPNLNNLRDIFNAVHDQVDNLSDALKNAGIFDTINKLLKNLSKIGVKLIHALPVKQLEKTFVGINKRAKAFFDLNMDSKWTKLTKKVKGAGVATKDFEKALIKTAKAHGLNIKQWIKEDGSLSKTLKRGWLNKDIWKETFDRLIGGGKGYTKSAKGMKKALTETKNLVNSVIRGDWGNGYERINKMTKAGKDYASTQKLVNKVMWGGKITLNDLTDAQLKHQGYTKKQIKQLRALGKQAEKTGTPIDKLLKQVQKPTGSQLMVDSLKNILSGIKGVISSIKNAYAEMFPKKSTLTLYNLIEKFNKFTKKLKLNETQLDRLKRIFKGVFAAMDLIRMITKGVVDGFEKLIQIISKNNDLTIGEFVARIADLVVAFHDWVKENDAINNVFDILANVIGGVINKVKDFFKLVSENEAFGKFISSIKTVFEGFSKKGWPFVKDLMKLGKSKIGKIIDKIKDFLENNSVTAPWVEKFENFVKSLEDCESTGEKVKEVIKDIWELLKKVGEAAWTSVKGGIGKLVDKVKTFLSKIDWGVVVSMIMGGFTYKFAYDLLKMIKILKGPFKSFEKFMKTASESLEAATNGFVKVLKGKAFEEIAKAILMVAGAIAILALACKLCGKDNVIVAGGVIALVTAALGILFKHVSALMSSGVKFKTFAGFMLTIAFGISLIGISLAVLVKSMAQLEHPLKSIGASILALGTLGLVLIGLTKVAQLCLSKGKLPYLASSLVPIAISLAALSGALYILTKAAESGNLLEAAGAIGVLMVAVALVATLLKSTAAATAGPIKSAIASIAVLVFGLAGLAGSMLLFGFAITLIAKSNLAETAKEGIGNIITVLTVMGVCFALSRLIGKEALKAGVAVGAIGFAVLALTVSLNMIRAVKWGTILKSLVFLVPTMLALGAILDLMVDAGKDVHKAGLAALGIAGAIVLMTASVAALGMIKTATLVKGTLAIVTLMSGLALVMFASKSFEGKGEERVKALIAIASIVGVFAAAIAALALIKDLNRVVASAGILTGVMFALAGVMYVLGKIKKPEKGIFKTLLLMTLTFVALASITAALSHLSKGGNVAGTIASAGAILILATTMIPLAEVLNMLAVTSKSLVSNAGSLLRSLGIMAVVFVVLGSIAIALSNLSGNWQNALAGAAAVAILSAALLPIMLVIESLQATSIIGAAILQVVPGLVALIAVLAILGGAVFVLNKLKISASTIGSAVAVAALAFAMVPLAAALDFLIPVGVAFPEVMLGIVALAAIILALTGVFALIGALAKDGSTIISGATIVGQAIGAIIGGVINGFATALMDPALATNISAFMVNLMPFFTSLQSLNGSMLKGALILAGAMLIFSAAGFIAGMFNLSKVGKNLITLGVTLGGFGLAVMPFLTLLTSVTETQLNGASLLADIMMQFAKDAIIAGIATFMGGGIGLVYMAMQLSAMGLAMTPFLKTLATPEMATAVAGAAMLAQVLLTMTQASLLNSLEQFVNKILGTSIDWSWFESMGTAVKNFATNTEGLSEDAVSRAETCAKIMETLINASANAPRNGGLVGLIIGKQDLSDFSESLGGFVEVVQGIDADGLDQAKLDALQPLFTAMKTLIEFANDIPDTKEGIFDKISGFADLQDFGMKLQGFASQFQQIGAHLSGMEEDKIEKIRNMGTAAKVLAEVATTVSKLTVGDGGTGQLSTFGTDIENFADHYNNYAEEVASASKNNPKKKTQEMKETLKLLMEDIGGSTKNNEKALKETGDKGITSMINSFKDAADSKGSELKDVGSDFGLKLPEGVTTILDGQGSTDIQNSAKDMASNAGKAVDTSGLKSTFETIGKYIPEGASKGVKNGEGGFWNTIKEMMNKGTQTAKDAVKEKSPSRVFMTIGGYLAEGLAIGVGDEEQKAVNAVSKMMTNTIKKAQKQAKFGRKVLKQFGNLYFDDKAMKNQKQYTRATKAASNAIKALGWSLYKKSDYFKQDKDAIKQDRKQIKEYNKQLKQLEKNAKKNQTEIKRMKKQIKDAKKQLKHDINGVAKHVRRAFNDTRNGIANSLRSFMDISNAAFDSGQNIFEKYYSPDAETIEEHKVAVEELTANKADLEEQIKALEGINTRASQKQIEDLNKELDEVNEKLDKAKDTLDSDNEIGKQDMIDNLISNAQGLEDYLDNLYALNVSGFNTGFIKKLKDMGIEGNKYIVAALSMSPEEQDQINASYERYQHDQAEFFVNNFRQNMKTVEEHGAIMATLSSRGFNKKALKAMEDMGMDMNELGRALLTMSDKEIKAFNKQYSKSLNLDTKVADEIMASYTLAGMNSAKGFAKGISKGTKGAVKAAKKMANKAAKAAKKELGIKSPSKVFAKIGDYCTQGFANGIDDGTGSIEDSLTNNVHSMIEKIWSLLNSEDGTLQPIISPVVDMENVENANGIINDMLTNDRLVGSTSMAISTNADTTNMQLANFQTSMETNFANLQNLLNGYFENAETASVTNNFNINSNNPKEVANEVSRMLQKQVERRQATWA